MSEYIHEIVLQEFVIDNIADLDLTVQYKRSSRMKLVDAVANRKGTFWDLNAKLENGIWIPLEVNGSPVIFWRISTIKIRSFPNSRTAMESFWY